MGVLLKNENLSEDMIGILKKFQSYLPCTNVNGEKKFENQLCVGDQLSVERAVNCIHSAYSQNPPHFPGPFNVYMDYLCTGLLL